LIERAMQEKAAHATADAVVREVASALVALAAAGRPERGGTTARKLS
jgi:hypothetical protein